MSQIDHIKKLLNIHKRNLQILKEKQALQGLDVSVAVLNQIAAEETEIEDLQTQLESFGDASEETSSPAGGASGSTSSSTPQSSSGGGVTFNVQGNVNLGDGSVITGRDAYNVQTQVTKNPDLVQIAEMFKTLYQDIDASDSPDKDLAKNTVQKIEDEMVKPEGPDEGRVTKLLKTLHTMAPDIFDVAIASFAGPTAGAAMVISKIGAKIKTEAA